MPAFLLGVFPKITPGSQHQTPGSQQWVAAVGFCGGLVVELGWFFMGVEVGIGGTGGVSLPSSRAVIDRKPLIRHNNSSVHQTEARSPRGWGCIVALDAVNTLDPLDDEDLRNRRFLMRYLSRGSTASRGSSATCPVSPPGLSRTVASSTRTERV